LLAGLGECPVVLIKQCLLQGLSHRGAPRLAFCGVTNSIKRCV
jgi:hypothetical protein